MLAQTILATQCCSGRFPGGLDHRRHRTLGTRKPPIRAITLDLVAREFGLGQFAGDQDRSACRVDLLRVPQRLLRREYENLLEHFDHVIVCVIVVVQKHHAVERAFGDFFEYFSARAGDGLTADENRQANSVCHCHGGLVSRGGWFGARKKLVHMKHAAARVKRNREYDPFARIYNRYWGVDYRTEVAPVVRRLLLSRLPVGAAVLDVCCGTGQFTEEVRRLGYDVAGMDASGEMIRYARENAPGVDFTVADVRDLRLKRRFDAAYSVYESLNHVPDAAGLKLAFACIRKHLKPGGPFLFDLNREEAYILYWNHSDSIVEDDSVCVMRSEFDEETKIGKYDIAAFERVGPEASNEWRREDFTLRQTCHNFGAVHNALFETGFRDVTMYDARDAGMKGDVGYGRTFFLCLA